ncbi:MAG: HAD-IIA family hydrolase [Gemmatimonadales bacterium]|jgi:HAD superfamily hydrolase (TIGR01458 family)|nr:HAD-IIA family hydrolase [Gemmatimonadales bacterium]
MAFAAVLLDLEGTLYVGDRVVPGAPEAIATLRASGLPFRLLSNTTSRSRAALVARLAALGIAVEPAELWTAPLAAARIAHARRHRLVAPFLPEGAHDDLAGLVLAGGVAPTPTGGRMPDAVLVGDLGERWTHALLQEAFGYVHAGADLVACSRDRYYRRGDGLALDAGPFVAALEYATGREAIVAGKPAASFFRAAVDALGLAPADVVMVGDDLWSDVAGAQGAGLRGWAVATGKFRREDLERSGIVPDRILGSIAELFPRAQSL